MALLKAHAIALLQDTAPRGVWAGLALIVLMLGSVDMAARVGLIVGNSTSSVPTGIYRAAPPETATYVTFCLGVRHRELSFYGRFCSPDVPDGDRILKRWGGDPSDQEVLVWGDRARAIDSTLLGPIRQEEIDGWWRPIVQFGARSADRWAEGA